MNRNRINTTARLTGMTIALAFFAGIAGEVSAQNGAKGGATKLLELSGRSIKPKVQVSDYKPMSCGKCKDEFVKRVDWTARGANKPTVLVAKHLCKSCGNEWVVTGHGRAKTSTALHKCTSCGAESLACCNTKKATAVATKGMDEKFEVAPLK